MKRLGLFLVVVFLFPVVSSSQDLRAQADAAWAERDQPERAMAALKAYEQLAAQSPGDAKVGIRLAEAAYWVVELDDFYDQMDKDEKVVIADKGVAACREILKKNEDHVEANYWLMWTMAARTYNKGIFSGFAFRDSIVGTIMVAKADVNYRYGGVYRYWARVIYEIPGLLGKFFHFSNEDTVWLYKRSIAVEPNYLRTRLYLAESYERMDLVDQAKKEYEFCANFDTSKIPEIEPENRIYKTWAKQKLEKM